MSFIRRVYIVLISVFITLSASDANEALRSTDSAVATAFLVAPGHLITAYHAVAGKRKLYLASERDSTFTAAEVVGYSETLDIALIRSAAKGTVLKIGHWQTFPKGAETYVIGFPKIGSLVSEKRITSGIYNGEQRFGSRQDWFQLSAEVHMGNSGSPVLGPDGNVYGVVSHKLDAQKIAKEHGDLPQNVNFALKSSKLIEFLAAYDIKVSSSNFNTQKSNRAFEVFKNSENSIFLLLGTNK
jgi:S1-C subfamily serine protease